MTKKKEKKKKRTCAKIPVIGVMPVPAARMQTREHLSGNESNPEKMLP